MPGDLVVAYLKVLAINALQITMRKENVANPLTTTDSRLFSFMNTDRGYIKRGIAFTITQFIREPVCMTFTGTKTAIVQIFKWCKKRCKFHE
jgi:hypothetical protein